MKNLLLPFLLCVSVFGQKVTTPGGSVSDAAYGPAWNGVTRTSPSLNAVYDALQSLIGVGALEGTVINPSPGGFVAGMLLVTTDESGTNATATSDVVVDNLEANALILAGLTPGSILGVNAASNAVSVTLGANISLDTNTMTLSASGGSGMTAYHYSPVSFGASTAETVIWTNTFAAGALGTNKAAVFHLSGLFTNNTTLGTAVSLTLRAYLGATKMYDATTSTLSDQLTPRPFGLNLRLRSVDSTTVQELNGTLVVHSQSTASVTTGRGTLNANPTLQMSPFMGTAAEDAATELGFRVTMQLATNHANVGIRVNGSDAFIIP